MIQIFLCLTSKTKHTSNIKSRVTEAESLSEHCVGEQKRRWTYDKMYCWHSQGDRSIGEVIRNYKDFVTTCIDKLQIIA